MLTIKKTDLESIYEHCNSVYPNEACGILAGRGTTVEKVYALRSENPSPTFYQIDAQEQFRVLKEMREAGRDLVGIYHSHPTGRAYPSSTDVELAYYPEAVYVIVSLVERRDPCMKGYSIVDGNVMEVPLNITTEEHQQ
ncbi:MAG TPA: M67 family metallopeptidase [Nitrospirota bacterium]|nr:M67 family metallopeptidase [Nitrospirota bacterium]